MDANLQVFLAPEQENSLRNFIYQIAREEFERAKKDSGVTNKDMVNQSELRKIKGWSYETVISYEKSGMPCHRKSERKVYYFLSEVDAWIKQNS